MKAGKLPQTVLERSVLRYVRKENKNEQPPAACTDAGIVRIGPLRMGTAAQTVSGEGIKTGQLALLRAVNSLAAAGATPVEAAISVTLPVSMTEEELKRLMEGVQESGNAYGITVAAGHTAVSRSVSEPVVSVAAFGPLEAFPAKKKAVSGAKVIMTKWCGLCGTALLAQHYKEELCTRYTRAFIEGAERFLEYGFVAGEAALAWKAGADFVHDAAEGGVFGALWELAEQADCGMEIDIRKIPIRQETVEICEYFDCNPYQLRAEGSLLLISRTAEAVCERLKQNGIPAVVIGEVKDGRERRLLNEDEVRFLEPNRVEEYERVNEQRS